MPSKHALTLGFSGLALVAAVAFVLVTLSPPRSAALLAEKQKTGSPPMAWSSSGGGWRAMAAGMGIARSLHRAGALGDASLKYASGNSGGGWFLSQLAYSEGFYANVTGETPMDELVVDWMSKQKRYLVVTAEGEAKLGEMAREWIGDNVYAEIATDVTLALIALNAIRDGPCTVIDLSGEMTYEDCVGLINTLTGSFVTAITVQASWTYFIERMLATADPALADAPATLSARHAQWRGPALSFQVANMTHSIVRGGAVPFPAESMRISAAFRMAPQEGNPLAYVVPGESSTADSAAGFQTSAFVRSYGLQTRALLTSGQARATSPEIVPGSETIPVARVAAFTSAFGGFLGSAVNTAVALGGLLLDVADGAAEDHDAARRRLDAPSASADAPEEARANFMASVQQLYTHLAQPGVAPRTDELDDLAPGDAPDLEPSDECSASLAFCQALVGESSPLDDLFKWLQCLVRLIRFCAPAAVSYFSDMAPCATHTPLPLPFSQRSCPFPRARLIDGGYVENLASAQTIGMLQRTAAPGAPLRTIIGMNADTTGVTPIEAPLDDLRALFSENGGQPFMASLSVPNATVFAAKWADVKASLHVVQGTTYAVTAEVSTVTVKNEAYGVAAGSPIEILVLSMNAPIATTVGVTTDPENYELLGALAKDGASPQVEAVVSAWLGRTT